MLNLKSPVSILYDTLEALSSSEVREHVSTIAQLLRHRSVVIRYAAASALGRACVGNDELRAALDREKNDTVIAEICEALAACRDRHSVQVLKDLASNHSSSLVRSAAVEALFEIAGPQIVQFLVEKHSKERSRRAMASLSVLLYLAGQHDKIKDVVRLLGSRDYIVRCRLANLIAYHSESAVSGDLLDALNVALSREETRAARSSLENAIRRLSVLKKI